MHRHVSCNTVPYLPAEVGFGGYHVSSGSETHLLDEKGSGATTCTMALGLLEDSDAPRVTRLRILPPYREVSGLPHVLRSPVGREPQA
jgi:hypothetical protein